VGRKDAEGRPQVGEDYALISRFCAAVWIGQVEYPTTRDWRERGRPETRSITSIALEGHDELDFGAWTRKLGKVRGSGDSEGSVLNQGNEFEYPHPQAAAQE